VKNENGLSLPQTQKQLTDALESVDSPIDERSLQVDLVRLDRAVPVARRVGSRSPCASAPTQCLRRKSPKRVALNSIDRLLLVGLYRLVPAVLDALKIVSPETLMSWHRAGFRAYWRWKSRPRGGRPKTAADNRPLEPLFNLTHSRNKASCWCRRTRISASNAARDRNSPIKAHQTNLQRSLIVELSTDSRASVSCFGFAVGRGLQYFECSAT
jgi:hypothetical protein